MRMERLEILVEEDSMEVVLRSIVPKIVGELAFEIYPYRGKPDLLTKLPARLRAYRHWLPTGSRIVVIVDRDSDDCLELKGALEGIAKEAGLKTRSQARASNFQVVNRIAVEELEAWYFGDWEAVREAFPRVPASVPAASRFRDPDAIRGGTWEALERVLRSHGYFAGGLRKLEFASKVAPRMVPERNRSHSFQVLAQTFKELASFSSKAE